jgi:rhodanese-related sulfurtransferase
MHHLNNSNQSFPDSILTLEGVSEIHAKELYLYLKDITKKELQVIDVRTIEEINGELGTIQDSKHYEINDAFKSSLEKLSKDKPTVFICRSGKRSLNASIAAIENGFKEVYNLQGGMIAFNEQNYKDLIKYTK